MVSKDMTPVRLRNHISERGRRILVLVGAGERGRRRINKAIDGIQDVQILAGGINPTGHPRWFAVIGSSRKVVRVHDYIPPEPGSGARIRLWIDFEKPNLSPPDDLDPVGGDGAVPGGLGHNDGFADGLDDAPLSL
jgi:hypothetical protein